MSLVIYKELLKTVVSKPWEFEGNKGLTHFMQTETVLPDGQYQVRKIKIREDMIALAKNLIGKPIDCVISTFAKTQQGARPFVEYMAINTPTANNSAPQR